ncbi:MAG: Bug family tripartite tricarboxylate transporter substrate binding protein [Pontibacterium sp.]
MRTHIAKTLATTAFTLAATFSSFSMAADYPNRDVRMVIPWGAGGGTDGVVRKLNTIAEGFLGGSLYAENIEGGISAIGVMEVMKSRPNGYTLGSLTYDSVVTVPWQGALPTYKLDKLKLIGRVTSEPDAIIVDADSKYQSLDDIVKAAKANPGKVKVGIQNIGSRLHLALLQLQQLTGTEFKLIAYPGGAAAQKEAILSNEVDIVATSMGDFSSLFESGDVRGIVEFSDSRNLTYPDVPTAKEVGVDLQMGSFIVIAAPANTPSDIVAKVEMAYQKALESDDFQAWVAKTGVTPNWLGSDEVTQWANDFQATLFKQMESLVEQGVLKK